MPKKKKKRVSKKGDEQYLSEALKDLSRELSELKKQKSSFETELRKEKVGLSLTQSQEQKLRDKISRLVAKEAKINEKRLSINETITKLKDKMKHVEKIKDELKGV